MRRFVWAARRRCPNCGQRGVVRGLRVAADCPACQHHFERHEGYWLGAIAINTVVTISVFVVALVGSIVLTWPDPPWTAITIGVAALNVILPIGFYPWSKLLWAALELSMHPPEPTQT
jgi:uncharacterized protein (DUF983 family)